MSALELTVVIPWRDTGDEWRRENLRYVLSRYSEMQVNVSIGGDNGEGPFNAAMALNTAIYSARHDHVMVMGADHVPDYEVIAYTARGLRRDKYVAPYAATHILNQGDTRRVLDRRVKAKACIPYATAPVCTGIVGFSKAVWKRCPFDERFHGWGVEDAAQRFAMEQVYGFPRTLPQSQPLIGLYHPESDKSRAKANFDLFAAHYAPFAGDPNGLELRTLMTARDLMAVHGNLPFSSQPGLRFSAPAPLAAATGQRPPELDPTWLAPPCAPGGDGDCPGLHAGQWCACPCHTADDAPIDREAAVQWHA